MLGLKLIHFSKSGLWSAKLAKSDQLKVAIESGQFSNMYTPFHAIKFYYLYIYIYVVFSVFRSPF